MSGHVLTVTTSTTSTDNTDYVNLSVADRSPTVITAGYESVLTSDVRTSQPLPRAEHQHAPAPAEDQACTLYVPGGDR